ncbi:MAG: glucose-1-phosphate cytidylyltransferase [Alphaproteobacteria bacterium]|nr:glucose-1-phosphate cytidylyltransferase [Alphaproteobacteria bacterium]
MPVMILCGGYGTRLREETEYRPKPMVEVGGRPILWHIMKLYGHAGHDRFVLCLGYKGHVIREFFLNYRAMVCDFTIDLGPDEVVTFHDAAATERWSVTCAETGLDAMTGARVRKALKYIDADTFCLTYGDGVADVDLEALLAFHKAHGRVATVTAVRPTSRYGELGMDAQGVISSFAEKPDEHATYINGGFFVFDRKRLEAYLPPGDDLVLERGPLERLVADRQIVAFKHHGFWQAMDTYREWQLLEGLWGTGKAPWATWLREQA